MSKARQLADLLDSNGDVTTGALDNVPPADVVNDTSPQLGGNLDGNGNTINLSSNTTSFGIPSGTAAQAPTASSSEGHIRYDTGDSLLYYSDGTDWQKVSGVIPAILSIEGNIYAGVESTITLTGEGFLSDTLDVNFASGTDSINTTVAVTASSDVSASVTVPSAVYNNTTVGNSITVKVTNTDSQTSVGFNKNAVGVPTGGSVSTVNGDRVHTFTTSTNFVVPTGLTLSNVDFLVQAGGGGGGTHNAGGGGAGGLRTSFGSTSGGGASAQSAISSMSAATFTIVVGPGAGRKGDAGDGRPGDNGIASSISGAGISTISATGGGGGCSSNNGSAGLTGGCGGGGASNVSQGSGTTGEGFAGGRGNSSQDLGGGGGTGVVGQDGSDGNYAGDGGNGLQVNIDGNNYYWGGGGGGAGYEAGDPSGDGGLGGGGGGAGGNSSSGGSGGGSAINGGASGNSVTSTGGQGGDGGANSGGGGGGTSRPGSNGGAGGKGIVIVRYTLP